MVDSEAIEEMNSDPRLDSEVPEPIPNGLRKTKLSVIDRPRPIGRALNSTFSAPHAESDRLVQTVLKSSKSFDRGRRYWLAAPEHVSAIIPPVPTLPSSYASQNEAVRIKRQSSMINLPLSSMIYSGSSPLPPPHHQFSSQTHDVPKQASGNDLSALETLKKGGFDRNIQLFEDQSPSLTLRDPSLYDVATINSSVPRRKNVFPQSLRSKLKPRRGPNYA
ncbi:hypothetical protein CROQUDRAFT_636306 [Cronartium quercuum f. sp. fusiforme G11]|uniref:Uncharacterized protein n=1 Tax=Cronartium quercuum f. sp. fusiforme G11 TaxID=708437 RepID=A0A9P6NE57_9BASI|nr:hypothetical protein CROQUDRAFT_636306 [Cronartium quercuum f. sp. fusiforme G11]